METVLTTLKTRYATFDGRASRKEYWLFVLFTVLVYVAYVILVSMAKTLVGGRGEMAVFLVFLVATLGLVVPSLALGFRRLHDVDRSAWWILIGLAPLIGWIILVVFHCQPGTRGPNRFGADPLTLH